MTGNNNKRQAYRRNATAIVVLLLMVSGFAASAQAQTRLVVRDSLGLQGLNITCLLLGCNVERGLGDPQGQLFSVTFPSLLDPIIALLSLRLQLGIVDVELDQTVYTQGAHAGVAPPYLYYRTPTAYYGATVWRGYLVQPAAMLIRNNQTHSTYGVTGSGVVVAVIDTGVDANNSVLKSHLVNGYDFTRNTSGGNEMADLTQSTVAVVDGESVAQVNQSTVAVVDQSTVAVVDGSRYKAFGHGTMVAGIVHLVAPKANIMPLKAFHSDGTAYSSDILRAIYYAANHGARVLNMSFSYTAPSQELATALNYAELRGIVPVASAGNDGRQVKVYPGALPTVIDVASTSNRDIQSSFTNYGAPPVWLAAPGEGVMTMYPFNTYAAGWGTSFSAPLVSGTAALLLEKNQLCNKSCAANAVAHADPISAPQLGYGRLDTYLAVPWASDVQSDVQLVWQF